MCSVDVTSNASANFVKATACGATLKGEDRKYGPKDEGRVGRNGTDASKSIGGALSVRRCVARAAQVCGPFNRRVVSPCGRVAAETAAAAAIVGFERETNLLTNQVRARAGVVGPADSPWSDNCTLG